jgi:hypothetical protein
LSDPNQTLNFGQWVGLGCLLVCLHLIQSFRSVVAPESD